MSLLAIVVPDSPWPVSLVDAACPAQPAPAHHQSAVTQFRLGVDYVQQGAYAQAMPHFAQALASLETTDPLPLVDTLILGYMGQIYQRSHQNWYALACYEAALEACANESSHLVRYCQMKIYGWLAELCQRCHHHDLANDYCNRALNLRQQIHPWDPKIHIS